MIEIIVVVNLLKSKLKQLEIDYFSGKKEERIPFNGNFNKNQKRMQKMSFVGE